MLLWSFICALLGVSQIILAANNNNKNVKNKNDKNLPQFQKQENNEKPVFVTGQERFFNIAEFVSVPKKQLAAHLEDVKVNGLAFTKSLIAHTQRAMEAAHPRNEILAKKNYLHLLLANSAIDFHVKNAVDSLNASDFQSCMSSLQISLAIAIKASHFHLLAHVPDANRSHQEAFGNSYKFMEASNFSINSLGTIVKNIRDLKGEHLLAIAKNSDSAAWLGNYFSTCLKFVDAIKSLIDASLGIQAVGLDKAGVYEMLHLYRMFGHFTSESTFMKTNNFDYIRTFSASLSEVHSLIKDDQLPKNNEVIEYLLTNKESKQMFPELVKKLAAAKDEQLRMEKVAKRKAMLKERQAARKAKEAEEAKLALELALNSPIKKVKSSPIRTEDLDDIETIGNNNNVEEDVEIEALDGNNDDEEKPFSLSAVSDAPPFSEGESEDIDLQRIPTVDQRDIDYGFILVGQFIKEEFLDPFRENYLGSPDFELSWTEFMTLIDEDDEEVHYAMHMIGIMDVEFLRSLINFYQARNDICHPTDSLNQSKEEIALNLRLLRGRMVPVQYQGIKNEVETLMVDGAMVDYNDMPPADYVPLQSVSRPRGFDRGNDVEATLASIKLYQLLFTMLILPLVYKFGLAKADQLDYDIVGNREDWATVCLLRYHLRPLRNRLCHQISSNASVIAYARMLRRERPDLKDIMDAVIKRASQKIEEEEENNTRVTRRGTYGFNNFVSRVVL